MPLYFPPALQSSSVASGGYVAGNPDTTFNLREFWINETRIKAWTDDPAYTRNLTSSSGTLYFSRIKWPGGIFGSISATLNNGSGASGVTAGYFGVYDISGNRLAMSTNQATYWSSNQVNSGIPLTAGVAPITGTNVPAQDLILTTLFTGSYIMWATSYSSIFASTGLSHIRSGYYGTGLSTPPSTIPMGSLVSGPGPWFAITGDEN